MKWFSKSKIENWFFKQRKFNCKCSESVWKSNLELVPSPEIKKRNVSDLKEIGIVCWIFWIHIYFENVNSIEISEVFNGFGL